MLSPLLLALAVLVTGALGLAFSVHSEMVAARRGMAATWFANEWRALGNGAKRVPRAADQARANTEPGDMAAYSPTY